MENEREVLAAHGMEKKRSWVNRFCQSFSLLDAVDMNANLAPNFRYISGYHCLCFVVF